MSGVFRPKWSRAGAVALAGVAVIVAACGGGATESSVHEGASSAQREEVSFDRAFFVRHRDRDGNPPIYEPRFIFAEEARIASDTLVIALSIGREAKAYPAPLMDLREVVNDELDGVPLLVTW